MGQRSDVVVIGGGPGGSVAAAQLARRGLSVIVLEKTRFPRFHLGESLLPHSLPVLAAIGVLDRVDGMFIRKYGARFADDVTGRRERFAFDAGWKPEPSHSFQVPRDAFDHALLRHAASCGAEVREGWTAERVVREGARAAGVVARTPEGDSVRIDARFVVDASGRDALLAHEGRATSRIDGLEQTAIFAHFEGVAREKGTLEGDIDIVLFRPSPTARPNWFWVIPFKDGRTSVGAVVSRAWMKEKRAGGADLDGLFRAAVAESKTTADLLASARMIWPHAEAAADFSYRVGALVGPGWLTVGDAAGFIDPLFSTGAHLAIVGGKTAADAIATSLGSASPDDLAPLRAWEESVRLAAETYILAVRAFYAGPLVDQLFTEDKHLALRRSITSLLAGDVFHEAIWLRDARMRLRAWAGGGDQVSF